MQRVHVPNFATLFAWSCGWWRTRRWMLHLISYWGQ